MASFRKIFLFFCFVATFITGCDETGGDSLPNLKPFVKGDTVSRTVLVYIMAENSISNYLKTDFEEIKSAAYTLSDDARLFVYFDNSDTTKLPVLYQYHPYDNTLIENVVYSFEEDVCSSDTATLGKVLDVIFADYPTKAFDLVMGSHADGWINYPSGSALNRSIGIDNEKNSFSNEITTTIEVEELVVLLERLPVKVDRLMFDACLMQGVEVAYALRNAADWIIGSPAEIPADGAPYDKVIPEFFNPVSTVEDIMYEYKSYYDSRNYAAVLSAVNTSYMQELAATTRGLVAKYFAVDARNNYSAALAYVPGRAPAYYDVNSVMKKFLSDSEYSQWKRAFDKAVPYIMVSNSRKVWSNIANRLVNVTADCGAVSAYFPQGRTMNTAYNTDFRLTQWYKAAGWDIAGW